MKNYRFLDLLRSATLGMAALLPLSALALDASLTADTYLSQTQPANNFGSTARVERNSISVLRPITAVVGYQTSALNSNF